MGLPLARVLLLARQFRVLWDLPAPCRRGAPLSHCRFSSAGCAGLGQLCDAVRAVRCRSRFVLLAQQASSSLMPGARPAR